MSLQYLLESGLPASLYEATVERAPYPALAGANGALECDVCVVGGGMAGLHTALGLTEAGARVVLLEARRIGWGASGRNGGHMIPEFASGIGKFETMLGEAGAQRAWTLVRNAGRLLRQRIDNYGIDCDLREGHLEVAIGPKHAESLAQWRSHAQARYGAALEWVEQGALSRYVGSARYIAGLLDREGGHLHPLKLCLGLAAALRARGAEVFEQTPVRAWDADSDAVRIATESGRIVKAQRLVLCANVGIGTLQVPLARRLAGRILPVGTWMIATEPLSAAVADRLLPGRHAVCDNRVVLDYFRLDRDNRLVFGGGCSYLGAATPQGFAEGLRQAMLKVFPELEGTRIDYAWGGVIDISQLRMPDVGRDDAGRVFYAQGFSGSGVVATAAVADVLCRALGRESQDSSDLELLGRIRQLPFPGGKWLRGPLTALGMLWHRLQDYS